MMKTYIGTKIVNAEPMNHKEFVTMRNGTEISTDQEGYMVVYEDGYVSWSPKDVFERCYREVTDDEAELVARGV